VATDSELSGTNQSSKTAYKPPIALASFAHLICRR
jgi:hypothetical protein